MQQGLISWKLRPLSAMIDIELSWLYQLLMHLFHCGRVMSYGGRHRAGSTLGHSRHQVITWTNVAQSWKGPAVFTCDKSHGKCSWYQSANEYDNCNLKIIATYRRDIWLNVWGVSNSLATGNHFAVKGLIMTEISWNHLYPNFDFDPTRWQLSIC